MRLWDFSKVTFGDALRFNWLKTTILTALLLFLARPVQATEPGPVVVELFTSQSCSDCPAADALLAQIAHNPDNNLIVLGCHVDSWDHRGWKDTLSLPECTGRQRDYAALLEQGRSYTPNMVVNGVSSFVGSRDFELDLAVRKARQKNDVAAIRVEMTPKGFEIHLPELPAGQRVGYELTLLTYQTNRTVDIATGDNHGQTITYAHAVSEIRRLDPWQGNAETRLIKPYDLNRDHLHGVVVIAQAVRGGKIRAAGEYRIYFN